MLNSASVQDFFNLCPDLLCTIEHRYFQLLNPAWQCVVGWTLAELRSRPWLEFLHPDDVSSVNQQFTNTSANINAQNQADLNSPICFQTRFLCENGSYVCLSWSVSQSFDRCIYATVREVDRISGDRFETYRQTAEAKLEESYSLLEAVVEGTTEHLFVKNLKGQYLLVNSSMLRAFNLLPEQVIGKTDEEIFPLTSAQQIGESDRHVISSGESQMLEEVLEIGTNTRTFLSSKSVHRDTDGKALGLVGLAWDITERKLSEEVLRRSRDELEKTVRERTAELRQSEQRLQAILDNSNAIIYLRDLEGKYIMVNHQFEKIFKVTGAEMAHKTSYDIFPPEIAVTYEEHHRAVLTSGIPITIEELVPLEDDTYTYISVLFPLLDDRGQPNALCSISTDITPLKRAEAETQRALETERELAKLRSQFICTVSHEFRTPLTSISLSADLLQSKGHEWDSPKRHIRLKRIEQGVKRMTFLLDDILTFSRADADKLELNPTSLDIVELCRELAEEIQYSISINHTIELRVKHEVMGHQQPFIPLVLMDEKLLRNILINLLSNGIKYSPSGSKILFELTYAEEISNTSQAVQPNSTQIIFKIQDYGLGIPPEDIENMFDAFYRGGNVGAISGTGLGLAIVKKSVDLHGGSIEVNSEINVGTTVTVIIPIRLS